MESSNKSGDSGRPPIDHAVGEIEMVEIPINLLQNIRNVIEVINGRVNWKSEELLPVGLMIQQIDSLLKKN